MKDFWHKLGVAMTGYDSRKAQKDFDALLDAFKALPEPKDYIPSTIPTKRKKRKP
jgi:hypothetical protein